MSEIRNISRMHDESIDCRRAMHNKRSPSTIHDYLVAEGKVEKAIEDFMKPTGA